MARDGDIDLSYVPTAEMLADNFTKPVRKAAFLKQSVAKGIIGIGLQNGLRNVLDMDRNSLGKGLRNHLGNGSGIGFRQGVGNARRKSTHLAHLVRGDPRCLIGSSSPLFTVSFDMAMIAILEEC